MRLLTEYMPVPEISDALFRNAAVVDEEIATTEPAEPEIGENRNLQLARQIDSYKTALIEKLSNFPITALWLLDKYSDRTNLEESNEEPSPLSESDELLTEISKHNRFIRLLSASSDDANAEFSEAFAKLKDNLVKFPYAFEDLVKLADLILYVFHDLVSLEATYDSVPKHGEIINKRLEAAVSHGLSGRIGQFGALACRQQESRLFLLLAQDLNESVREIVLAEHEWLHHRKELAAANAKLVLFIANQYKGSFLDFDDLVQEGHTGLLKAVDRFKYRLGFQFSTYAGYWIRQAISRALSRSERVVRIPCGQVAAINKLYRSKDELMSKTGADPTIKELAEYCQLSADEANQLLSISQTAVALEPSDESEDESSFAPIDYLEQQVFNPSFKMIADSQLENLLRKAVNGLSPREAKIISAHFGVDNGQQQTLQDIGNEMNLTRERVRQIQAVALNKIKIRYGEQLVSFIG